ncbi:MAG: PAS domain-containing sensor histidine kinase [Gammaproteobacteria bacterium]|nr:PAS domain-containing sensor histidine kinase [Gammaproteobacteria bacterium]
MTHAPTHQAQGLEDAFHVFTQVSEQLSASYLVLENRVAQLTDELAAARSERLLQLAEKERLANRLTHLLTVLPAGVVVLNGAGRIQEYNPLAVSLLGEPLLGLNWAAVAARVFAPELGEGQELLLRDGRRVSLSTSSLGTEPGQILLLRDVTEVHALQEGLSRHQRLSAMGEMAAALAHQIRTPLSAALLYTSQLVTHRDVLMSAAPQHDNADYRQYAGKVLSRLRHLERLVNDMLVFAKGGHFGAEEIEVAALLQDLQQATDAPLSVAGCRLEVLDEAPEAKLYGNREALLSALQNLVSNAMQACGKGGRLQLLTHIVSDPHGSEAVNVLLSDNGPGIPDAVLERIFEPFFTTRAQGTGLGLAVVQAIVRAHQGMVWVESEPGQGSTFGLRLPLKPAKILPSEVAQHTACTAVAAGFLPPATLVHPCTAQLLPIDSAKRKKLKERMS